MSRAPRPEPAVLLAQTLGWEAGALEARILADWMDRAGRAREELVDMAGRGREGRQAWNRMAASLALELQALLGRSGAEGVLLRIPLHRINVESGEVYRADLDGRPLE